MPEYKAPLRDIRFTLFELLECEAHYKSLPGAEEATPDTINMILEEAGRLAEEVLAPLYETSDQEGCKYDAGVVTTPTGFKEAYREYAEGGWPALAQSPAYGGQQMPSSMAFAVLELVASANYPFSMYPGLARGAIETILAHGTEEQKSRFLPPMISGEWTGTMCLTESHCGTDLGLLRTRAEPAGDGSYRISGTKIFISAGEHDLVDNIVHIVLARLPDAPKGVKGISLFIVPKVNVNEDGSLAERNGVSCGAIEKKMGIHGNATCVLNFDGAKGYLIGPPHQGLSCMFTFMNAARIGTGLQGVVAAERAFQGALAYARERLQMRSLSGPKAPDKPADPIIVHPDVRRMLLTQKAFAEGGRALFHYCAQLVDLGESAADEADRQRANDLLALLTPIAKAFPTETGFESVNHGLQVFGGHGYIREWGMEQIVRDTRIGMIYEGTTGVQALDLLGRKVLGSKGKLLQVFAAEVTEFCDENAGDEGLRPFIEPLRSWVQEWQGLSMRIGEAAQANPEEIGAASVDYLMYTGYGVVAYLWARAARVAQRQLAEGTQEQDFYRAKLQTARFYFQRLLPRTRTLATTMVSGADNLMDMAEDNFAF